MMSKGTVAALCLAVAAVAGPAWSADAPPTAKGCGPSVGQGRTAAERAAIEARTLKAAMGFAKGTVEEQDALLAPDALFWALGIGYLNRDQYVAMHKPGSGPARGKPTSYKQTINNVIVQGDKAAIDMDKLVVWPDFTYDQHYSIIYQVQNDKICLLKIFSSSSMAKAMLPDIEKSVAK